MTNQPDLARIMARVHDNNGGAGTVGEANAIRNCHDMLSALKSAGYVVVPREPKELRDPLLIKWQETDGHRKIVVPSVAMWRAFYAAVVDEGRGDG